MKGFFIAAAFGFALLGATVLTAGSALASGEDDSRVYGGYPVYKYFGALLYGTPHHHYRRGYRRGHDNYRPSHRRARRHDYSGRRSYSYQRQSYQQEPSYQQGRMDYQTARPCRATSKFGYDHGRRARIGGTMCYDTYGTPYIVRGSRYVIQYY